MDVPEGYPYKGGLLQFARKRKTRFNNLIKNEIAEAWGGKTQFGLFVKFSFMGTEGQRDLNRNNEASINTTFNCFIDKVRGKIEAWSQRGSGWVKAFVQVAIYEPLHGGGYMSLLK